MAPASVGAEQGGRARGPRCAIAAAGLLAAACAPAEDAVPRWSRYGVFRDLVRFDGRAHGLGVFFLDRFETTRRDWWTFSMARGDDDALPSIDRPWQVDDGLPATQVDLRRAREFARWRFCRLPRIEEWRFAATSGGLYAYPWGNRFRVEWVNSGELGLDGPVPVGTFESGRDADDRAPYDLLGNVAEWTESVGGRWFGGAGSALGATVWWPRYARGVVLVRAVPAMAAWAFDGLPPPRAFMDQGLKPVRASEDPRALGVWWRRSAALSRVAAARVWLPSGLPAPAAWMLLAAVSPEEPVVEPDDVPGAGALLELQRRVDLWRQLRGTAAVEIWRQPGVPPPAVWAMASWGGALPRLVVGGHFRALVRDRRSWSVERAPGERGDTLGVRVATDPLALLCTLLAEPEAPTAAEERQLRGFLAAHRDVLAPRLAQALQRVAVHGPLRGTVTGVLGG